MRRNEDKSAWSWRIALDACRIPHGRGCKVRARLRRRNTAARQGQHALAEQSAKHRAGLCKSILVDCMCHQQEMICRHRFSSIRIQHFAVCFRLESLRYDTLKVSSTFKMTVTCHAKLQFLMLFAALPIYVFPADAASAGLQQALAYAKAHQQTFNEQLMDLIAIPSISALPGGSCA